MMKITHPDVEVPSQAIDALDASVDAVAIYTAEPWLIACTIVYANEALARLSGFAREHLVGHSALLLAGARPDTVAMATVLPPFGRTDLELCAEKQRPDGSTYRVHVTVTPLRGAGGDVTHYLARQTKLEGHASLLPGESGAVVEESGVFPKCETALDEAPRTVRSSR